jgi:hypothetical protein
MMARLIKQRAANYIPYSKGLVFRKSSYCLLLFQYSASSSQTQSLDFAVLSTGAIEKHVISMGEGAKWLRELEERDQSRRFVSSIAGFGVFARKK